MQKQASLPIYHARDCSLYAPARPALLFSPKKSFSFADASAVPTKKEGDPDSFAFCTRKNTADSTSTWHRDAVRTVCTISDPYLLAFCPHEEVRRALAAMSRRSDARSGRCVRGSSDSPFGQPLAHTLSHIAERLSDNRSLSLEHPTLLRGAPLATSAPSQGLRGVSATVSRIRMSIWLFSRTAALEAISCSSTMFSLPCLPVTCSFVSSVRCRTDMLATPQGE